MQASIRGLGFLLLSTVVTAQTSTSCNPTEKTCSSDTGLDSTSYSVDFTQGSSDDWNVTYGSVTYDSNNGATFTISESGDAPTIQTNFYIFFGVVSIFLKAATGTGIVSSAILESDDLDEIDWEWLGGSADEVETNYFGKGNTSSYDRADYYQIDDTQSSDRNYTIVWTKEATTWYVDGELKRTLNYADAVDGTNYPQTPMRVKLGVWAGGDSSNSEGTIEWAGGSTNYDDGPFNMYVTKVEITNYNPASTYTYSDTTGDYSSITLNDADADTSSDSSSGSSSTSSISDSSSISNATASNSTSSNSSASSSSAAGSTSSPADVSGTAGDAATIPGFLVLGVGAMAMAFMMV
ncbi:concanavalin A-like lectin/glucanase domain-containing protein [Xylariaceae sp. FL0016]|nr:concanavalin A-like lectin/glucanase domain-containing protein [Xylariaceae sp. FL0016]